MKNALKFMEKLNTISCYIAMVALFVLMFLTTIDTMTRKTTIGGITDSMDFTERLMLFIIFGGLAIVQSKKGHIRMDMLVKNMPKVINYVMEVLMGLASTAIMFLLSYGMFLKIFNDRTGKAATQLLHIPTWPFTIIVTIMVLLYAVTLLFHVIQIIIREQDAPAANSDDEMGERIGI